MSALYEFSLSQRYVQETCCNCGCGFALTLEMYNKRQADGTIFYCPNGHSQHYTKTRVQVLEQQLKEAKQSIDWVQAQRNRADRQAAAARGQVTKIKNRIHNGVCPCCKRSFQNLKSHIRHMHPTFLD